VKLNNNQPPQAKAKKTCNQKEKQKTQFTSGGYHLLQGAAKDRKNNQPENKKKSQSKKITGKAKTRKTTIHHGCLGCPNSFPCARKWKMTINPAGTHYAPSLWKIEEKPRKNEAKKEKQHVCGPHLLQWCEDAAASKRTPVQIEKTEQKKWDKREKNKN